jgi:hypothetical protein
MGIANEDGLATRNRSQTALGDLASISSGSEGIHSHFSGI